MTRLESRQDSMAHGEVLCPVDFDRRRMAGSDDARSVDPTGVRECRRIISFPEASSHAKPKNVASTPRLDGLSIANKKQSKGSPITRQLYSGNGI